MITPTHVVTNALLSRRFRRTAPESFLGEPAHAKWFVIGGLAPDVGLYVLTAGAAVFYPLMRDMSISDTMELAFDDLFFNNPVWVTVHNTLHSPVVLAAIAAVGKVTNRTKVVAFALGCLLHTAMDIPVHHHDGPLVFFPFDWDTRFHSPVSYYDPDHYGRIVAPIDFAITAIGGAALLRGWIRKRKTEL